MTAGTLAESIALSLVNDGSYDCEDGEDEPYGG